MLPFTVSGHREVASLIQLQSNTDSPPDPFMQTISANSFYQSTQLATQSPSLEWETTGSPLANGFGLSFGGGMRGSTHTGHSAPQHSQHAHYQAWSNSNTYSAHLPEDHFPLQPYAAGRAQPSLHCYGPPSQPGDQSRSSHQYSPALARVLALLGQPDTQQQIEDLKNQLRIAVGSQPIAQLADPPAFTGPEDRFNPARSAPLPSHFDIAEQIRSLRSTTSANSAHDGRHLPNAAFTGTLSSAARAHRPEPYGQFQLQGPVGASAPSYSAAWPQYQSHCLGQEVGVTYGSAAPGTLQASTCSQGLQAYAGSADHRGLRGSRPPPQAAALHSSSGWQPRTDWTPLESTLSSDPGPPLDFIKGAGFAPFLSGGNSSSARASFPSSVPSSSAVPMGCATYPSLDPSADRRQCFSATGQLPSSFGPPPSKMDSPIISPTLSVSTTGTRGSTPVLSENEVAALIGPAASSPSLPSISALACLPPAYPLFQEPFGRPDVQVLAAKLAAVAASSHQPRSSGTVPSPGSGCPYSSPASASSLLQPMLSPDRLPAAPLPSPAQPQRFFSECVEPQESIGPTPPDVLTPLDRSFSISVSGSFSPRGPPRSQPPADPAATRPSEGPSTSCRLPSPLRVDPVRPSLSATADGPCKPSPREATVALVLRRVSPRTNGKSTVHHLAGPPAPSNAPSSPRLDPAPSPSTPALPPNSEQAGTYAVFEKPAPAKADAQVSSAISCGHASFASSAAGAQREGAGSSSFPNEGIEEKAYFSDYFQASLPVYTAESDPHQRVLYRARDVAGQLGAEVSNLCMFLKRLPNKLQHGVFQASAINEKVKSHAGLKRGAYFIAESAVRLFAAKLERMKERPPRKRPRKRLGKMTAKSSKKARKKAQ